MFHEIRHSGTQLVTYPSTFYRDLRIFVSLFLEFIFNSQASTRNQHHSPSTQSNRHPNLLTKLHLALLISAAFAAMAIAQDTIEARTDDTPETCVGGGPEHVCAPGYYLVCGEFVWIFGSYGFVLMFKGIV